MKIASRYMDAITMHYYTIPSDDWANKGSATDFTDKKYYRTLRDALRMDEIINKHLQVMIRHDPEHKVEFIVDEWGSWYDVEPGTNPGFLYQQNTMRDAIIAAITLDIFNSHSDRVVMANLAQIVNVLQSVVLTEGNKMVLTPTYHVFDLYKNHHDAVLLGHWLDAGESGIDGEKVPMLSATVSEKDEIITLTMSNLSANSSAEIMCDVFEHKLGNVAGRILSEAINAKNDFSNPNVVSIKEFAGIKTEGEKLSFTMPACSVAEITIS